MKERRSLRQRVVTSVIAIPIIAALIWFGAPWFTLLGVGWGLGAVHEFYVIIKRARAISPLTLFGMGWVVLFIISPHFESIPHLAGVSPVSLILTTGVILPLLFLLWRRGKENAFADWAWTIGGILYIGWLLSNMVYMR